MKRMELLDEMLQHMPEEELLESLVRAISDDEAAESFEYIARMHGFNLD